MFWLDVIKEMKKRHGNMYFFKHLIVCNTTGPNLIHDLYTKNKNIVVKLPRDLINNTSICSKNNGVFNYLIDEHAKSWNNNFTMFLNICYCKIERFKYIKFYEWIMYLILIILFCIFLYYKLVKCRKTCSL